MSDEQDKGFQVRDRRIDHEDEAPQPEEAGSDEEPEAADEADAADDAGEASGAIPMTFSTLCISLGTSALAHLGEVPDPMTGQKTKDLGSAKQTIDILGLLEEKTRGNLSEEENKLLTSLLYDLRMRFVQAGEKSG